MRGAAREAEQPFGAAQFQAGTMKGFAAAS